jgi:hypothetical protein
MKKFVLIILVMAFAQVGHSQILISLIFGDKLNTDAIEFGLDGGLNISWMNGFESTSPVYDFNLGFYFDFRLKNQWYINTGVEVKSNVGLNNLTENDVAILDPTFIYSDSGTYRQQVNYFEVPANIKYRFKNHFYVKAGPQFALRGKSSLVFEGETNNKDVEISSKNGTLFDRFQISALAGIGYKLKQGEGMYIEVRYYYGLTNAFKGDDFNVRNSSMYFNVGIPIGKDKKPKETTPAE